MSETAVRVMMATEAYSKTDLNISRDEPGLCYIESETDTDYIGRWATGFGFVNVRFPKKTTRDLTPEERDKFSKLMVRTPHGDFPALPDQEATSGK